MDRMEAWDYEVKVKTILSKLKLDDLQKSFDISVGKEKDFLCKNFNYQPDFQSLMNQPTT